MRSCQSERRRIRAAKDVRDLEQEIRQRLVVVRSVRHCAEMPVNALAKPNQDGRRKIGLRGIAIDDPAFCAKDFGCLRKATEIAWFRKAVDTAQWIVAKHDCVRNVEGKRPAAETMPVPFNVHVLF